MATLKFDTYSDSEENDLDNDDKPVINRRMSIKTKERVILMVGLTGSGKSSIIKSLCSQDDDGKPIEARMSIHSVTKNLHKYSQNLIVNPKNSDDMYNVTLVDTVGVGDHNVNVQTILLQIIERMAIELSTIHRVVFCFKMDRLRAIMSEELSTMYDFFKMLGAKPENFLLCLTFCDLLNQQTIDAFWNELRGCKDLAMTKEVQSITYTSFPNLDECDDKDTLVSYLKRKIRISQHRVYESIIQKDAKPFHPYDAMIHLSPGDFVVLCDLLRSHHRERLFYWNPIDRTELDDVIGQMKKWRTIINKGKRENNNNIT